MKQGRFIQAAVTAGRCRVEVAADVPDSPEAALMSGGRGTIIEIDAAGVNAGAGAAMSEEQWRKLVSEVDKAIEQEKRGGC